MVKLYFYQLFHITSFFFIDFWWEFFLLNIFLFTKFLIFLLWKLKKYLKNSIVVSHCIIVSVFFGVDNILCVVDWINV